MDQVNEEQNLGDAVDLLDVAPVPSLDKRVNCAPANAEPMCKLANAGPALSVQASDIPNLSLAQNRDADSASTLFNHVPHVVSLSTKEQMIRSYAGRVVATVKDALSCGNRPPVMHFPRHDVGGVRLSYDFNAPVSVFASTADPQPTRIRFLDLRPKALMDFRGRIRPRALGVHTSAPTELRRDSLPVHISPKRSAADLALVFGDACGTMVSGHGVTSQIGCKVSRLVRVDQHSFGPFSFYHVSN